MNVETGPLPAAAGFSAHTRRGRIGLVSLVLAILLYGVGYLVWYLGTPLGRAPQLDAAENLALARKIATGTLAHEPFYRAMLYPAVLAVPLRLGWPTEWLAALASVFGLLCHFAITLAVARLASRLWAGPRSGVAAILAAALWGLNPVALFYAVDVLDVVPSLVLFVWGLVWWIRPGGRWRDSLVGGVFLGLAVAARPHFLPVVVVAPFARAWLSGHWRLRWEDIFSWAGAGVVLLALGFGQLSWSGQFRILPWQGPYNFYAANRTGANGRYYVQQMYFQDLGPGENPARKESEIFYSRATNKTTALSVDEMNSYWRRQAHEAIVNHPVEWMKLMVRKAYYLFNDFDQYNNKTYAWHQGQSPWLRWNFLGWGILLVLTVGAGAMVWLDKNSAISATNCASVAGIIMVFCAYAAGVLLYYTSGRFRLPMMPLLCVLSGGWAVGQFADLAKSKKIGIVAMMVMAGVLTFSGFLGAHDTSTFIQDEMLSANAAAAVGEDAQAYELAQSVLARDATRLDARRVAVVSYFNLSVSGANNADTQAGWQLQLTRLPGLDLSDSTLVLVAGVTEWKIGNSAEAEKIWQNGAKQFGPDSMPARALAAARQLHSENTLVTIPADPQLLGYLKKAPINAAN